MAHHPLKMVLMPKGPVMIKRLRSEEQWTVVVGHQRRTETAVGSQMGQVDHSQQEERSWSGAGKEVQHQAGRADGTREATYSALERRNII